MKKLTCTLLVLALIGGIAFAGGTKDAGNIVLNKDKPLVFLTVNLQIQQLALSTWRQ